jgi:cytochrome c-type biogenesis protein CcmH/NrfG
MDNRKLLLVFIAGALAAALIVFLVPRMFSTSGRASRDARLEEGLPPAAADYSREIADLKTRLTANPNDIGTLVQLGNLNYDSYQAQALTSFCVESIRYYEKALALRPGDPNVLTDLGYMYRCNGQVPEAVARFRMAMKAAPSHPQSRMNLGVTLFYDQHDYKGAREAFTEFLKLNPDAQQAVSVNQLLSEIDKAEADAKAAPAPAPAPKK